MGSPKKKKKKKSTKKSREIDNKLERRLRLKKLSVNCIYYQTECTRGLYTRTNTRMEYLTPNQLHTIQIQHLQPITILHVLIYIASN